MYEKLVTALRGCVLSKPCDGCPYYHPNGPTKECATMNIAAADAIEEMEAQIDGWIEQERKALLKSMPKWIPVTERLPESMHEYVLCCGEKGGQFVGWVGEGMIVNGKARAFQHGGRGRYITHWMPLPTPPKEETE